MPVDDIHYSHFRQFADILIQLTEFLCRTQGHFDRSHKAVDEHVASCKDETDDLSIKGRSL